MSWPQLSLEDQIELHFSWYTQGPGDCLNWTGVEANGYGKARWKNVLKQAHRVVWEIHHGEVPEGMVIMHTCDNTLCGNIDHLRLGTQGDNVKDCYDKGRRLAPMQYRQLNLQRAKLA